jgi:hypothetical protein
MFSGPAQNVDSNPPSFAKAFTTPPCAVSANKRSDLYKFDLPDAFAPVTTFRFPSGIIK